MKRCLLLLILIYPVFISCESKKASETERTVNNWMYKTIKLPNITPVNVIEKYAIEPQIDSTKEYKILLYIDSTGCTYCKLNMNIWKQYIEEMIGKTNFFFYFHPKNEQELLVSLKRKKFNYPVYIDNEDEINTLNHFPKDPMFQCFLLDKNNNVLAVGNPAINKNIWKLYKKIITGEILDERLVTFIKTKQSEIELKELQIGKISEAIFVLKNTGTLPMIIQMVDASCGCTVPEWEKQPISAGKSTEIKVKITPDAKGYFNKTITVHCNTKEGQILLTIKGMVE
jgi:hypothetical protein